MILDNDQLDTILLELVQRGHTIIAEVLKLSNEIPLCFRHDYTEQPEPVASVKSDKKESIKSRYFNQDASVFNLMSLLGTNIKSKEKKLLRRPVMSYCETSSDNHGSDAEKHHISSTSDETLSDGDFSSVLIDFTYLGTPETFDNHEHVLQVYCDLHKINNTSDLPEAIRQSIISKQEELEQKLISQYEEYIRSFVNLFSRVYVYHLDINKFWNELKHGRYILHSTKSIMRAEGLRTQLICELLYLFGSALLMIELYIPGTIRERMIIAHHRYCRTTSIVTTNVSVSTNACFDGICKAFQKSNFDSSSTRPPMGEMRDHSNDSTGTAVIPNDYMTRMPIDPSFVQSVIDCLMDNEIFSSRASAFPSIEHRSIRLCKQAQMLAIIVHFRPEILTSDRLYCRQIMDRFFLDSWCISLYNGFIIDLLDEWDDRYPAAKSAINDVLSDDRIRAIIAKRTGDTITTFQSIDRYISQQPFSSEFVLDHLDDILNFLRDANDLLKWEMLHRGSTKLRAMYQNSTRVVNDLTVVDMIFSTSRLDELVIHALNEIVPQKEILFNHFQSAASESMMQLSNYFGGNGSLSKADKTDDVGMWFHEMGLYIRDQLSWNEFLNSIQHFMESLKDITQIDSIDTNDHLRKVLISTEECVRRMAKLKCLPHDICTTVDTISDFSECRGAIEYYIPIFHMKVKTNPEITSLLSSFFVKATSFLKKTVVPGIAPNEPSAVFVRDLHTNALVSYVKMVLDVIPISVFSSRLFERNFNCLMEIPNKIEAYSLINYAYFEERLHLASLTYELSTLTRGINDMEDTSVGDVKLEPQKLLEEGLRKELVRRISHTMQHTLQFDMEIDRNLKSHRLFLERCHRAFSNLANYLDEIQRVMVWIQDYLNVSGIEIYHDEYQRIVWQNIAMDTGETMVSVSKRLNEIASVQSLVKSTDGPKSYTFLGRTINALVKLVDHKFCVYSRMYNSWFLLNGETVCDMKTIRSLRNALDISGLKGLNKVIEFQITNELKSLYKFYENATATYGAILEKFRDDISPEWQFHEKGLDLYAAAIHRISKLIVPLQAFILRIGQLQLLRIMISEELSISTRLESLEYHRLMIDDDRNALSSQFYYFHTVFTQPNALEGLPSLIVLFLISISSISIYDEDLDAIRGTSETSLDGGSILVGIVTLLSQFHPIYAKTTVSFLFQYIWIYEKEMLIDDIVSPKTTNRNNDSGKRWDSKNLMNKNRRARGKSSADVHVELKGVIKILSELSLMCKDVQGTVDLHSLFGY